MWHRCLFALPSTLEQSLHRAGVCERRAGRDLRTGSLSGRRALPCPADYQTRRLLLLLATSSQPSILTDSYLPHLWSAAAFTAQLSKRSLLLSLARLGPFRG